MPKKPSPSALYDRWLRQFLSDAAADDSAAVQRHIDHLGLECSSADLLLGTGQLVAATMAFLSVDGQEIDSFLNRQSYRPGTEGASHYFLMFNMGQGHFGRLIADREITHIDFADLFDYPWEAFETAGFTDVFITRIDGTQMEADELDQLYQRFTEDIYFDYGEDEVAATVGDTELHDTALATAYEVDSDWNDLDEAQEAE
jgi:hypothetical protein